MGSIGTSSPPKTWIPIPYMNSRDCSEGFCSFYCPQWCYIIAPPSPSFDSPQHKSSSALNLSPLVIAIIGILVSAFLLVSYYTIMSKYCGRDSRRRSRIREDHGSNNNQEFEGTLDHSIHEPWCVVTAGLDEALIKSLTVCKYKIGDVLMEGTDCAVCLSEFEEDESLRLLPKCNHAFHIPCIDTWLKSHSNCPLCRASVVPMNAATQHQVLSVVTEPLPSTSNEEVIMRAQDPEESRDTAIDIGGDDAFHKAVIRSVSMDCLRYNNRISVADILHLDEEEDEHGNGWLEANEVAGSSKQSGGGTHSLTEEPTRHVVMKRSYSSGRSFLTRPARSRHTVIPL